MFRPFIVLFLFIALLFSTSLVYSQKYDETDVHINFDPTYSNAELEFSYLLADSVSLRECPSSVCRYLGLLRASTKLTILDISKEVEEIKGIRSSWYKIKTNSQDTIKIGWIWGGFIAEKTLKSEVDLDIKFFIGLDRIYTKEGISERFLYKIKAMKDTFLLDEILFKSYQEITMYESTCFAATGIEKLDDVVSIHIPCVGGCGCSTGEVYFFWSDNKFKGIEYAMGTADAEYSEGINYIFPSHLEGEKNFIITISDSVDDKKQANEKNNDVTHRMLKKEYFKWNGEKLIKVEEKTKIKRYKM